jgi:hypothetical protein
MNLLLPVPEGISSLVVEVMYELLKKELLHTVSS